MYFLPKHSFPETCPLTNINMWRIVTTDTLMHEKHFTVVADWGGAWFSLMQFSFPGVGPSQMITE